MTTLLTIFLVIGGIGFLFLIISLILGDLLESLDLDFDVDHDLDFDHDLDLGDGGHFGILDSRVISIFMTAFGGAGAVGLLFGFGGIVSALFGIGAGIIFGALIYTFGSFLISQEASSSVTSRDLVGRTAKVVVKIQEGNVGQISCRVGDERIEKLARSRDGSEIRRGAKVFIEEVTADSFIVSTMEDHALLDE